MVNKLPSQFSPHCGIRVQFGCLSPCRSEADPPWRVGGVPVRRADGHHGAVGRREVHAAQHPGRFQVSIAISMRGEAIRCRIDPEQDFETW